ncbi:MAG: hypothetical protein Q4A25_00635 [Candidatus Saccharibacteria bacterium]|nr:hypothetical protein [Candidatus Saccharibacteria bacterium]
MLKQVVVFGNKTSEDIIGNMIEDNLPVEVTKVGSEKARQIIGETESAIREQTEEELLPYIGKVDAIVLCEPEMTLSSIQFLKDKYPEQEFVGYGQNLSRVIKQEHTVRILLPHTVRRMSRYQKMKSECFGVEISEGEYDFEEIPGPSFTERFLEGFVNGLIIIYTPALICLEDQLKERTKWRATVVDMCGSLFRETCKALKFRGIDGGLSRDLKG